jgi:lysophospholipase L1-like esterase
VLAAVILVILLLLSFMIMVLLHSSNNSFTIRVACVGDSITEGTEYPRDLQKLLGAKYTVGNFGAGGSTVLLSSDKPYMFRPAYKNAIAFQPNIVFLMLGTNDANPKYFVNIQEFVKNYEQLINHFQTNGAKVWLVFPPPIFNDTLGPKSENLVNGVIPLIEQVAKELGLPTINVYSPLLDHPNYFWDGVHPNSYGAAIIAAEVYSVIFATGK